MKGEMGEMGSPGKMNYYHFEVRNIFFLPILNAMQFCWCYEEEVNDKVA